MSPPFGAREQQQYDVQRPHSAAEEDARRRMTEARIRLEKALRAVEFSYAAVDGDDAV